MTLKQKLFVKAYMVDLNATKAAIAAGYSQKTAYSQGQRLLKHVEVRAELDKSITKRAEKLDISAEKVLAELAKMGFSNMRDYIKPAENGRFDLDIEKATREQWAAVQEITVDSTGGSGDGERRQVLRTRFKLADKRGSLELLGNHLKLFNDKPIEVKVELDVVETLKKARARVAKLRGDNVPRGTSTE